MPGFFPELKMPGHNRPAGYNHYPAVSIHTPIHQLMLSVYQNKNDTPVRRHRLTLRYYRCIKDNIPVQPGNKTTLPFRHPFLAYAKQMPVLWIKLKSSPDHHIHMSCNCSARLPGYRLCGENRAAALIRQATGHRFYLFYLMIVQL